MLAYDALIEQARLRVMPLTKMRGILREYLQVLILKEIYGAEAGRSLYFTGGTYLRLIHGLKRFSEDLDFNAESLNKTMFNALMKRIGIELNRLNIEVKVEFNHWDNIFSAQLSFPSIEKAYGIISKFSGKKGIVIKVETNNPKWKIKKEAEVISAFAEIFPCICTDKAAFFADKVDALNKKSRARHLYDIIFMLANKFPIDTKVAKSLGIVGNPFEIIQKRVNSFSASELKKQAQDLRLFLFDEKEADLIVNARTIIPTLIQKYATR